MRARDLVPTRCARAVSFSPRVLYYQNLERPTLPQLTWNLQGSPLKGTVVYKAPFSGSRFLRQSVQARGCWASLQDPTADDRNPGRPHICYTSVIPPEGQKPYP